MEKPPKELNEFDQAMNRLKKGRSRRKKHDKGENIEDDGKLKAFVEKMEQAASDDVFSNGQKEPALNKLKMLPEVQHLLKKKMLQEQFVECGVLKSIYSWLKPLPDGSLPNLKVRTVLLELLNEFTRAPLDILKDSGVGRAVMVLWKHPSETPQNKKLANTLIEKWSRPIFGISEKYKDLREEEEQQQQQEVKKKKEGSAKKGSSNKSFDQELETEKAKNSPSMEGSSSTFHARIPEPIAFDFKVKPKSSIPDEILNGRGSTKSPAHRKLEKKIDKMKTQRIQGKYSGLSIEGRNLLT